MSYPKGHERWVTEDFETKDRKCLTLTKARLGEFMYHLLALGGTVRETFTFDNRYPRCFVQFAITLPNGLRPELERLTGIGLRVPDRVIVVND